MASAFAHAVVAFALGKSFPKTYASVKFWLLGSFCAILPDLDVLAFKFGIPYEHLFGHRGITHSIAFSLFLGLVVTRIFYHNTPLLSLKGMGLMFCFFLCTVSHALLDAMTSGGLGVAFYAPFDNTRYFFPWRPIQVSPIGVESFFSEWGLCVVKSELIWVGIPGLIYLILLGFLKKIIK